MVSTKSKLFRRYPEREGYHRLRGKPRRPSRLSSPFERNNVAALRRENESLLRVATGQGGKEERSFVSLWSESGPWRSRRTNGRRHRRPARLLRGRHEEVRSDNNEFRCRPFRPSRSASRKLDLAARLLLSSLFEFPLRRATFFFAARCRTIASNFYCANRLSRPIAQPYTEEGGRATGELQDQSEEVGSSVRSIGGGCRIFLAVKS